jgi:hypothetical protein
MKISAKANERCGDCVKRLLPINAPQSREAKHCLGAADILQTRGGLPGHAEGGKPQTVKIQTSIHPGAAPPPPNDQATEFSTTDDH